MRAIQLHLFWEGPRKDKQFCQELCQMLDNHDFLHFSIFQLGKARCLSLFLVTSVAFRPFTPGVHQDWDFKIVGRCVPGN